MTNNSTQGVRPDAFARGLNVPVATCAVDGCNEPGKLRPFDLITLPLCEPHLWDMAAQSRNRARRVVADIYRINPEAQHTEGWTYVIRLANGNVKIGTTVNPTMERLKDISRRDNDGIPVQVLAIIEGGFSRELLAHGQWFHLRVPGAMEEFYPAPELLQWAGEQGITPALPVDHELWWDRWLETRSKRTQIGVTTQAVKDYIGDGPLPFQEWNEREAKFLTERLEQQ